MLRKIKLYGNLAEFVGHKEFEAEVSSVGNAVSFLIKVHAPPAAGDLIRPELRRVFCAIIPLINTPIMFDLNS